MKIIFMYFNPKEVRFLVPSNSNDDSVEVFIPQVSDMLPSIAFRQHVYDASRRLMDVIIPFTDKSFLFNEYLTSFPHPLEAEIGILNVTSSPEKSYGSADTEVLGWDDDFPEGFHPFVFQMPFDKCILTKGIERQVNGKGIMQLMSVLQSDKITIPKMRVFGSEGLCSQVDFFSGISEIGELEIILPCSRRLSFSFLNDIILLYKNTKPVIKKCSIYVRSSRSVFRKSEILLDLMKDVSSADIEMVSEDYRIIHDVSSRYDEEVESMCRFIDGDEDVLKVGNWNIMLNDKTYLHYKDFSVLAAILNKIKIRS